MAGQLYPQAPGGAPLDGAISADPAALAGFLELTGPVTVPGLGVTLDAGNVEDFLLRDQYVQFDPDNPNRKELLGDVAQATFDALTSRPLPGIATLTTTLGPLVEGGHLRVAVDGGDAEAFLDRIGLSGRWAVTPGADYLSVRSASVYASKIDSFLHRSISVDTRVDRSTGQVRETVTVVLRNDAPASGLPTYILGPAGGTNRNLVTIYSPHPLASVTVDGQETGAQSQQELGGPAYTATVDIPPGGTRTVVFELVGVVPAWPYRFDVLPSPTANPDQFTLRIDGAPGLGPSPQFDGDLTAPIRLGPA